MQAEKPKASAPRIGRFHIVGRLSAGPQSSIYLGADPRLSRHVAIKTLPARLLEQADDGERLWQEARAVCALQHPNIIQLYEATEFRGLPYLVFEYVRGRSLATLIRERGALPLDQVRTLFREVLAGIGCAHEAGILHLDIKPSNIMIATDGHARVTDFGIARLLDDQTDDSQGPAGSPRYMAPEHFSSQPLSPRSDVFALGLLLYEMLTGHPAFDGHDRFRLIYQIVHDPLPAPSATPGVDPALDEVVLRAVQKDPAARYADAREMAEALAEPARAPAPRDTPAAEERQHSTVEFLLRRMQRKKDFPALSQNLAEINRLASADSMAPVKKLANVILRDYALTNKLLKLANSAYYAIKGDPITNVSRAISVLGFRQVRIAATSLTFVSHLQGDNSSNELKDALVSSFMSALMARHLAQRQRYPDIEEAFICGMFNNLGRNLVIYYFPEEHAEIRELMDREFLDELAASRSILGIAYDELGIGVAQAWKFPENLVSSMRAITDGQVAPADTPEERLRQFACFANSLCRLADTRGSATADSALASLAERYHDSLGIAPQDLARLVESASVKVGEYGDVFDFDIESSGFMNRVRAWCEALLPEEDSPDDAPPGGAAETTAPTDGQPPATENADTAVEGSPASRLRRFLGRVGS